MRRLASFVFGLVVGGSLVYTTLKFHVVRAADGMHLVPKLSAEFSQAYVDIRDFDLEDWAQHQTLAIAMTRADESYLLQDAAMNGLRNAVDDMFNLPRRDP